MNKNLIYSLLVSVFITVLFLAFFGLTSELKSWSVYLFIFLIITPLMTLELYCKAVESDRIKKAMKEADTDTPKAVKNTFKNN